MFSHLLLWAASIFLISSHAKLSQKWLVFLWSVHCKMKIKAMSSCCKFFSGCEQMRLFRAKKSMWSAIYKSPFCSVQYVYQALQLRLRWLTTRNIRADRQTSIGIHACAQTHMQHCFAKVPWGHKTQHYWKNNAKQQWKRRIIKCSFTIVMYSFGYWNAKKRT